MTTTTNPKETIEIWPIERLVPYAVNAKIHEPAQVTALAKLIKKFGWTQPIVVQRSNNSIIAGHGRRLAAIELGLERVPVLVMNVTGEEARALRLADNRVSSTNYDAKMIQSEIFDLNELGFDISLMNFAENELAFLTADIGEMNSDAFVKDISGAVETQKAENATRELEIAELNTPIARAFGVTKISIPQSRRVKSFMTLIEESTGKAGISALMAHFDTLGIAR